MTETVIISSRQTISITEECVTIDANDSNLLSSEQRTGWNDLFSDDQHQIARSCAASSSISDSLVGKPQDWGFRDLRNTAFATIDEARKYCREGQRTLAIEAYKNTFDHCVELERRNKNSGENRIEFNRQISIMKVECRRQFDEMTNDIWANESSSSPTTNHDDQFSDIEFCKTLYQKQTFVDNDQFEMLHPLAVRRLVRMIINKNSCNIYSDPVHDLPQEQTEQELLEIHPRPTRQCGACIIEQSLDQFEERYSDQCQHIERMVCNTCVYNNTKSALEDMQSTEVICPESDCQAIFGYNEVYQVLLKSNNRTLFEFYDRQLTDRRLEQMSEFNWCPYPGCGSGQLNERNTSAQSRIICIKCKRMICSFHRTIWHTGMTCDEYDRSNVAVDGGTKQWLHRYSKQCPQCKSSIQKNGGCDHMSCKKCNYQFCWECLANYKLIISQGLRQHKLKCSHYPKQRSTPRTNRFRRDTCALL